jgi:hypothetical protein
MKSLVVIANKDMMTKESIERLKQQKKNDKSFELKGTIKLKYGTIEALKELSRYNNDETYDQIVMKLVRFYKERTG